MTTQISQRIPVTLFGVGEDEKTSFLFNMLRGDSFELIEPATSDIYQRERAALYGVSSYNCHSVVVINIKDNQPIPFGVLSADINNKSLPIIFYTADTDAARKVRAHFMDFLRKTNQAIHQAFNVRSFDPDRSNIYVVDAGACTSNPNYLLETVQKAHAAYIAQNPEVRKIREEAKPPASDELEKKRALLAAKQGLQGTQITTFSAFKEKLDINKPVVSFFGPIFKPVDDVCDWAAELGSKSGCNLLYGLMGQDTSKAFREQSVMYQFTHNASRAGCQLFGAIPYEQVRFEENRDFSELGIKGWFVTPQLKERLDLFALSQMTIVGSCGTGTYEEVLSILRRDPKHHLVVINTPTISNQSLVDYLSCYKSSFPNVCVVTKKEEFTQTVQKFYASWRPAQAALTATPKLSNDTQSLIDAIDRLGPVPPTGDLF